MDELDADHDLSIGIVTGAGGNFSAGADMKALARGEFATYPPRGGFGVMRRPPRKPLIAAVEGVAMWCGLELCLACESSSRLATHAWNSRSASQRAGHGRRPDTPATPVRITLPWSLAVVGRDP
jgi:hypothetical protein